MHEKVIVINDCDGHAHVLEYNESNLRSLCKRLVEIGRFDTEISDNATTEELEDLLYKYCVVDRSGGGIIYLTEVKKNWDFRYGPFE